jgi:hypothetical protein
LKTLIRTVLLAAMVFATASGIHAQISVGIVIGAPPPVRVVRVLPERPGPEFVWVEGYWYPVGNHYKWHRGYWTQPPYEGARWVAPRHDGERYFVGYWEGDRGRVEHEHHWDRDRERDHDRDRDHERHGDHEHDRDHR